MNRIRVVVLLVFILAGGMFASPPVTAPPSPVYAENVQTSVQAVPQDLRYIIIAGVGQSNEKGVSAWREWPAEPTVPGVTMWSYSNRARGEPPEPAHQPVYYDLFQSSPSYPHQGGMSLLLPMAKRIVETHPGLRVLLLTCTGPTIVGVMQPGMQGFELCATMMQEAIDNYGATPGGIVTFAGEADTGPNGLTLSTGVLWGPSYIGMVNGFRSRFNAPHLPAVHFELMHTDAIIYTDPDGTIHNERVANWTTVEYQQHNVLNYLTDAEVIDPDPWAVLFDHLHADTATNERNGIEAAEALSRISGGWTVYVPQSTPTGTTTPTKTPVPTWTATPTKTPTATPLPGCSPRPPMSFHQQPTGLLTTVITVNAPSTITSLTIQGGSNATVSAQPAINGTQATFTVTRAVAAAWRIDFTVTDGCGPLKRFEGSGG